VEPAKIPAAPAIAALTASVDGDGGGGGGGGLIVLMILAELKIALLEANAASPGMMPRADWTSTLLIASVDGDGGGGGGGGLIVLMILAELKTTLFTAWVGRLPTNWSFLEPLRPALSLPLMEVATKAATAKQATIILMGEERVMVGNVGNVKLVWERYCIMTIELVD
jgi:hypothetical protein